MKVLAVGGGAREHAIVKSLVKDGAKVFTVMKNKNPGLARASEEILLANEMDIEKVAEWGKSKGVDFAVVGPEAPLGEGIVDELAMHEIPAVGPTKFAAQLEISKEFCRDLLRDHKIPGSIDYWVFDNVPDLKALLKDYDKDVVMKPIGLTGGKGVKVMGEHLMTHKDVIDYAQQIIDNKIGGSSRFVVEEKIVGEEFTLQAFADGRRVVPMPSVMDHKRAYEGDTGPNTGGMGSYSMKNGLPQFATFEEVEEAVGIMQQTVDAMRAIEHPFHGTLYGGFILTREGPRILEYNVRFGDPEAMNVLPLLEDNFVDLCGQIMDSSLPSAVKFAEKATVCKYVTPVGYGVKSQAGEKVFVDEAKIEQTGAELYYASVDERDSDIYTTTSRSLAIVGIDEDIAEAERMSESALQYVSGKVFMRHDIGKPDPIEKRIRRMEAIRRGEIG